MNKLLDNFLSLEERGKIDQAVTIAELQTSGEIKVLVVEKSTNFGDVWRNISPAQAVEKRAITEFLKLGIQDTRDRTGVLIMISLKEKRVSIKADKDINDKVKSDTWQVAVNLILNGIKDSENGEGICKAVKYVGEQLARFFPRKADDVNEISNGVEIKE